MWVNLQVIYIGILPQRVNQPPPCRHVAPPGDTHFNSMLPLPHFVARLGPLGCRFVAVVPGWASRRRSGYAGVALQATTGKMQQEKKGTRRWFPQPLIVPMRRHLFHRASA